MAIQDTSSLSTEILSDLGEIPSVAFYEAAVAEYITGYMEGIGLSVQKDKYGNIITNQRGGDSSLPAIAFVAHMDHPGFEAFKANGKDIVARALGGVPQSCFSARIPVQIVAPDGQMVSAKTCGRYGPEGDRTVSLEIEYPFVYDLPCAVVFDLPGFYSDGKLVHMRALDDLGGCASILVAMTTLVSQRTPSDVYCVFTRAEEVGLVGARLLAEEGVLPLNTIIVSVETSRTLPGATIGDGPVIRVGDASFTFNHEAESVLINAVEKLQGLHSEYKVQRQLMSGGTCEASAFAFYGYRATGIALPLGNYHNAGSQGGVEAEYIHMDDFVSATALIVEVAHCVDQRFDTPAQRRLRDIPQPYRMRLMDTNH